MAKVVVKSKVKKVKRKFPIEIKAPEVFKGISLGKSEVTDLKKFSDKTVKMNLMYITKNVKNQNIRLHLKVSDVSSGVATTQIQTYVQIPYYLNRFVKKGSDLVEDSFICLSKDNKNLRVKPFIITKSNVSSIVLSAIQKKVLALVSEEAKKRTAEEFIYTVTTGKIQFAFRGEVKKIAPLKAFEFKKIEVLD